MSNITVGISDLNVAKGSDVLVTYALGSCIGICLYDSVVKVAGLSHIMLPSSKLVTGGGNTPMKFADTGVPLLVKKMEQAGCNRIRMKAKIAGGAQMFALVSNSSMSNIGQRNIEAVKAALALLRIPIIAEDVGKNYGRTVWFAADTGIMKVTSANKGQWTF